MQIAGWLLREPFSRAGDVLGVRGAGGSLGGDAPASRAPRSLVPGCVSGHWGKSVPFLHTPVCMGDVGGCGEQWGQGGPSGGFGAG